MPDPSVIRHGEYYYAFGTTGAGRLRDGRAFKVLRSADLVHWEERGGALAVPASDIRLNYWAPDVAVHAGRFYLYYSMGRPDQEKFDLRVGTSAAPEGPYVGRTDLFVYHAWDAAMKVRQMCIDRLEWTPEGPRCIPTTTPQPLP
jgi:beta-xylosidase